MFPSPPPTPPPPPSPEPDDHLDPEVCEKIKAILAIRIEYYKSYVHPPTPEAEEVEESPKMLSKVKYSGGATSTNKAKAAVVTGSADKTMAQGGGDISAAGGDPWVRRRTAPMRFAPQNKNKVTVSLPEAVAVKEDKMKLQRLKSARQTRSSTSSASSLFTADPKKVTVLSPASTSRSRSKLTVASPSPSAPVIDLEPASTSAPGAAAEPKTVVVDVDVEEYEESPIKVLQTPISMFEFKATTKFNVLNALSMGLKKCPLNVYGEPCAPVVLEEDLLEVEVVPEKAAKKGPEGSEYGQEERLAAKKLRLKRRRRAAKSNPKLDKVKEEISLKIQDEMAHYHEMKGNPRRMNDIQGSYYVLIPDSEGSGELHAHPVKDWCTFEHLNKNKPLTEEEAEETFQKRDKILNLFSIMVGKRLKGGDDEEDEDESSVLVKDGQKVPKKTRKQKLEDSDVELMDNDGNESDESL